MTPPAVDDRAWEAAGVETDAFLRQLAADGERLAATAAAAEATAPVPGLEWTVGDVVAHTGAVHRWCADLVRERRTEPAHRSADFAPPPDEAPVPWFAAGHAALLDVLAAVPADVTVWGFGRPVPARAFWTRRQAHETAIHRADVEAGAGRPVTAVDPDFAQDGLAEVTGFARGFRSAPSERRLGLVATDGDDWVLTFAGGRIAATRGGGTGDVDATVSGSSSDLYLWAWNRPSAAVVAGDPAVAALWQDVRVT